VPTRSIRIGVFLLAVPACLPATGSRTPGPAPLSRGPALDPPPCGPRVPSLSLRAAVRLGRDTFLSGEIVTLAVEIENPTETPITIEPMVLVSPSLLIEVRDVAGAVLPSGPPPTPSGRSRTIAPHEKLTTRLSLHASSSWPAGEYRACAREGVSNTVVFRILDR